jgi:DNA-binding transcriptional regulator YhcF (GntR family)
LPRNKIKLPKEYVELYKKNPNLKVLAENCNVNIKTAKLRLEEMGIITIGKRKGKYYRRVFSKEFLENRRRITEQMVKYFERTNIQGKTYHPSPLQKIGYYKR